MKLLFEVGSTCVGGAERVVLRIAQGIKRLRPNWKLECVVLTARGGLETEYQATFPTIIDGPPRYEDSGLFMAKLIRERGYDVVHCIDSFHFTRIAAQWCNTVAFLQNVFPNVAKSPHGPNPTWLADQNNPYSAIVTEFKANMAMLPRPGRAPHALECIPNGIDTTFWCPPNDKNGEQANKPRTIDVLWVARTDPEKGISIAMDLVPLLCNRGLNYVIVTSEPDGPRTRLLALEAAHPTFRYLWRLSPIDLRELYRRSKIFIQTSSVEGMPATPLEAAACGCWPLCSAVDGVAEVFEQHPAYLVGQPITAELLASAVLGVLRQPQWLPQGNAYARQLVLDRYSVDNMVNSYIDLYERINACGPTT